MCVVVLDSGCILETPGELKKYIDGWVPPPKILICIFWKAPPNNHNVQPRGMKAGKEYISICLKKHGFAFISKIISRRLLKKMVSGVTLRMRTGYKFICVPFYRLNFMSRYIFKNINDIKF